MPLKILIALAMVNKSHVAACIKLQNKWMGGSSLTAADIEQLKPSLEVLQHAFANAD